MMLQYAKRHSQKPNRRLSEEAVIRFMAVMGSGGHTMELSSLIRSLKQKNYNERYYIIADTDILSEEKVILLLFLFIFFFRFTFLRKKLLTTGNIKLRKYQEVERLDRVILHLFLVH